MNARFRTRVGFGFRVRTVRGLMMCPLRWTRRKRKDESDGEARVFFERRRNLRVRDRTRAKRAAAWDDGCPRSRGPTTWLHSRCLSMHERSSLSKSFASGVRRSSERSALGSSVFPVNGGERKDHYSKRASQKRHLHVSAVQSAGALGALSPNLRVATACCRRQMLSCRPHRRRWPR